MTQPVHIVALAVRCAIGLRAESAAAAVRAGISRISEHPFFIDAMGDKVFCARDPQIDPTVAAPHRILFLIEAALQELVNKITPQRLSQLAVPLLIGLPEPRPGLQEQHTPWLQRGIAALSLSGLGAAKVELFRKGHASSLLALQAAAALAAEGLAGVCIAGGADTYLDEATMKWLDADLRLARTGVRGGFPPGEAAVLIAVANESVCRRLNLPSLGILRNVFCAQELRSATSTEGLLGEGLTEAVVQATNVLHVPRELVTDVYCDINGERSRAEDWGCTLLRESRRFVDGTAYVTSAGQCGDIGAASGALGCVLAVQAGRRKYARGPHALVWAESWGGLRGAALLQNGEG